MKKKFCLVLLAAISLSALADKATTSAPANAAPAAAASRVEPRTVPLVPGPAVVSVSPKSRVMVRGEAKRTSEIITRMTNGESVTVIEEIQLAKTGPDEPSAWAKIALPEKASVWVNAGYINADKTVKPRTLRLRAGPGENHSIVGTLKRGDTIKELETKGEWIRIETPPGAHAFMAAQYLIQQSPVVAAAEPAPAAPTEPAPSPATVAETPIVAAAPTDAPPTAPATETPAPEITPAPPQPPVEEPLPPRIVEREGVVRGTVSIQAPTRFSLVSPDTRRVINYLYTTSTNLDLSRYKGLRIVVTGEEGLDKRWKNTPIITIQRIQVLE